jgi:hypothetical protein
MRLRVRDGHLPEGNSRANSGDAFGSVAELFIDRLSRQRQHEDARHVLHLREF